jgi:hypothetical protein
LNIIPLHQSQGARGTDAFAGRAAFQTLTKIALVGDAPDSSIGIGLKAQLGHANGPKRTGLNAGLTTDALVAVDDDRSIDTADGPGLADSLAGGVLAVFALDGHGNKPSLDDSELGVKIVPIGIDLEYVFTLMGDDTGYHAGSAADTEHRIALYERVHAALPPLESGVMPMFSRIF